MCWCLARRQGQWPGSDPTTYTPSTVSAFIVSQRLIVVVGVTVLVGACRGAAPAADAGSDREVREYVRLVGALADRYEAFERRHLVSSGRARTVFERALAACRERTLDHLSLPPEERVDVQYVSDSPWNAYSRYHGGYYSTVQVNLDFGLTVDGALALACHE